MLQAVWFDAGAQAGGPVVADASIILRWTAYRGAFWCRIWRRPGRRLRAALNRFWGRAAPRCGGGRNGLRRRRRIRSALPSLRSGLGCYAQPALYWLMVCLMRIGTLPPRRPAHPDAAGGHHRGVADAGAGSLPRRHQRCAVDRTSSGGCAVVPAAGAEQRHCSATRCRGPWARGDLRRR